MARSEKTRQSSGLHAESGRPHSAQNRAFGGLPAPQAPQRALIDASGTAPAGGDGTGTGGNPGADGIAPEVIGEGGG
jgi:hypothetical protein